MCREMSEGETSSRPFSFFFVLLFWHNSSVLTPADHTLLGEMARRPRRAAASDASVRCAGCRHSAELAGPGVCDTRGSASLAEITWDYYEIKSAAASLCGEAYCCWQVSAQHYSWSIPPTLMPALTESTFPLLQADFYRHTCKSLPMSRKLIYYRECYKCAQHLSAQPNNSPAEYQTTQSVPNKAYYYLILCPLVLTFLLSTSSDRPVLSLLLSARYKKTPLSVLVFEPERWMVTAVPLDLCHRVRSVWKAPPEETRRACWHLVFLAAAKMPSTCESPSKAVDWNAEKHGGIHSFWGQI